ncbi:tyrosine-type recombinase/integrase [Flindersiella endophytica]
MKDPIRKIVLADKSVRYRFVVDVGRDENGKRLQLTRTFDTLKEARAELSRIRHETNRGVYVKPSEETLNQYLDEYLKGATRGLRVSTATSYHVALQRARDRLGYKLLQAITKKDVEDLVDHILTAARKSGGTKGTGLTVRSARYTLGRLTAALEMAVKEGKLARNPAKLVTPPTGRPKAHPTWSKEQVRQFLAAVEDDRLHAAWRLTLYGLRRGEVLGLRWSDLDLTAKSLTVRCARIVVDKKVRVEEPKSENGKRTLPLDDVLVSALSDLREQQVRDAELAGTAYQEDEDAYLVTDALGTPVHPNWYSREFARICARTQLPKIRLHDSRHTTLSLMEKAGVPISVISKWAGHHDAAFTMRTYVHASNDDLQYGAVALNDLYKIA